MLIDIGIENIGNISLNDHAVITGKSTINFVSIFIRKMVSYY